MSSEDHTGCSVTWVVICSTLSGTPRRQLWCRDHGHPISEQIGFIT